LPSSRRVRQGAETRYYESGAEHVAGEYVDGTQSGVWRYRFSNGRNWRAERWDDGALVAKTVDPAVARMSPEELEALGPTDLDDHQAGVARSAPDPRGARAGRGRLRPALRQRAAARRRRLRRRRPARRGSGASGTKDGHLAREIEYLAGVREHAAREWHPNGAPAVEGFYVAGEREGRWRWWDARGQLTGESSYAGGTRVTSWSAPPVPAPAPK
jgi:hypothetical protein